MTPSSPPAPIPAQILTRPAGGEPVPSDASAGLPRSGPAVRREVIVKASLLVAVLVALAACGSDTGDSIAPPTTQPAGSTTPLLDQPASEPIVINATPAGVRQALGRSDGSLQMIARDPDVSASLIVGTDSADAPFARLDNPITSLCPPLHASTTTSPPPMTTPMTSTDPTMTIIDRLHVDIGGLVVVEA